LFFGVDQTNQSNRTTSVNTPLVLVRLAFTKDTEPKGMGHVWTHLLAKTMLLC